MAPPRLSFDQDELVPDPAGYNKTGPAFSSYLDLADSDHTADSDQTKVTHITPRFGGYQVGGSYARCWKRRARTRSMRPR